MVDASQCVPDDTLRTHLYSSIATVATQLQEISSDRCGRYMLRSQGNVPIDASSSTPANDAYVVANIPSPLEVLVVSDVDALHHLGSYLASDLLDSYRALSTIIGIPLQDIGT